MLRVANVCLSRSWGGLEMSALRWAHNLAGRGHEVRTLVAAGSRLSDEARARGLDQVTIPLAFRVFDPRASARIRNFLKRNDVQVVQAHNSKDLWILYVALLGMTEPRLFYASRIMFKNTTKRDLHHRLVYARLNGVTVLTEVGKKYFAASTTVPDDRIRVIPNGFDVGAYDLPAGDRAAARAAVRGELGLAEGDLAIGSTSRIDVQKGQRELVEAFRQVLRHTSRARLVLVGEPTLFEGGQYLDFLKRKVKEHGLEDRVVFAGFRKDIPRVLNALDIFVMPSYEETFGNCLVEAMLAGLACVSTDAGGVPEVLEGGRLGILADPRSVESLARALETLMGNPELRRELGLKARESARRRFNLKDVVARIEDMYTGGNS